MTGEYSYGKEHTLADQGHVADAEQPQQSLNDQQHDDHHGHGHRREGRRLGRLSGIIQEQDRNRSQIVFRHDQEDHRRHGHHGKSILRRDNVCEPHR